MNMKLAKYMYIITICFSLIGCTNIESGKSNHKFFGTWNISGIQNYLSKSDKDISIVDDLVGNNLSIDENTASIGNEQITDISYKLKVANKQYVLSYEDNLTMEKFLGEKDSIDIISIIHEEKLFAEFFLIDDNEMILIYKSAIFSLNKISNTVDLENIKDNSELNEEKSNEVKEGVMLGIKTPRIMNEDGEFSKEQYKTIWISYENGEITEVYEKEEIMFPRMNGIWSLKIKEDTINNNHYDFLEVNSITGNMNGGEERIKIDTDCYKSINFIGNNYIAIEKYSGNNFQGVYPIYQFIPVDQPNTEDGVKIYEVYSDEIKKEYDEEIVKVKENISKVELENLDIAKIDYSNFTMKRHLGKWVLTGRVRSKNIENEGLDFILPIPPNKNIINYNRLYIPWKTLKGELGFFEDVHTSPLGALALVKYSDYLSAYEINNGDIQEYPLFTINLNENDEIIMAEWCSDIYVEQWEKVFLDGKNLRN